MKNIPHHHILKIALFLCILSLCTTSHAQHVLSQLEVREGAWNAGNEFMVSDPDGNIYLGFKRSSWMPAVIGDTVVYGSRLDTVGLGLSDFFYAKLDQDHHVQHVFVIDNAEYVRDFNATNDHSFISLTLFPYHQNDSLNPIILGGEVEIPREGNRGHGVLVVLDKDLKLQKALIPSTGELGQVAGDGDFVYMELIIPDQVPYILVGQDTVHNFKLDLGGLEYGFQTVVLCKYDYVHDQVIWWKRIGNVGQEELQDMQVDHQGNLIIQGLTSSGKFTFSETDTVVNYQPDKPFIGKYSAEGTFLWGKLNTNQSGELFYDMNIDAEDNIYILGEYTWPEYRIGDTVLYNEWQVPNNPTDRGITVKFNRDGEFEWISQLEGIFESSNLYDIAFTNDDLAIISGKFRFGVIKFGQNEYEDTPLEENTFLWVLDASSGRYHAHAIDEGTENKWFPNLFARKDGNLNMYMLLTGDEDIFDDHFSSYMGNSSGFLLKVTTDFPSSVFQFPVTASVFNLFPNPVSTGKLLFVNFDNHGIYHLIDFTISNSVGHVVMKGTECPSNGMFNINTSGLISGTYFLTITIGSMMHTETLIVV